MREIIDIPDSVHDCITGGFISKDDYITIAKSIANGRIIEDDKPALIYKGQVAYLTDEHIQAMAEWEKEQMKKEVADYLTKCTDFDLGFEPNDTKTHFPKVLYGTTHRDNFCPHAHNCIEYFGSHCADRCPLKKENEE